MSATLTPTRGRLPSASASIMFEVVRPLTATDIALLTSPDGDSVRSGPPPLQTLKSVHRRAARLLAAGKSVVEVAVAVGRTPQRIRDLQKDPSFADLVATYVSSVEDLMADEHERAVAVAVEIHELAMDEIRERLDDEATRRTLPLGELRQLAAMTADRTVLPVKQNAPAVAPPTSITFNIAGRAKLRDEGEAESTGGPIVDVEAEPEAK